MKDNTLPSLPETCPKCGFSGRPTIGPVFGVAVWSGPTYRATGPKVEHLEFECNRCVYRINRPVLSSSEEK